MKCSVAFAQFCFISGLLTQCAESELSFVGSPLIEQYILREAIEHVEKTSHIEFGEIRVADQSQAIAALHASEGTLGGLLFPLPHEENKEGLYQVVIGYDTAVILVHKKNRLTTINRDELRRVYSGRSPTGPN